VIDADFVRRCDVVNANWGKPVPCPGGCGDTLEYEPPHEADPSIRVGVWHGGYSCCACCVVIQADPPPQPGDDE